MMERRSFLAGLSGGAVLALAAVVLWIALRHGTTTPAAPAFSAEGDVIRLHEAPPMKFVTAPVEEGQPLSKAPVTARVAPVESRASPCYAPLEGRIERVVPAIGDRVKAGTRLVLLRSADLASMLRELKGALLSAQTKKALVDRLKFLVESRGASANDLLVAENEYEEAQLAAKTADARLKSLAVAEESDNLLWVLAPRSGTIIQIDAQIGQVVGPNRDHPIATIADLDEVLVLADVPQRDAAGLQRGMTAQIRTPGLAGEPLQGRLETVSEVVDPERQTVPVRIRVANSNRLLRPNSFVEAMFSADAMHRVLQVPAEAVVSDGLTSVVFVQTEPGAFRRREVTVGRQNADRVELVSGVRAGERVVTRGALLLLNALDLRR